METILDIVKNLKDLPIVLGGRMAIPLKSAVRAMVMKMPVCSCMIITITAPYAEQQVT